ncbi:MAG: HD domain-containing protein [Planctomycetes bacterium]|nr:HD domain-containing protein [Planctomycetota bacterium]
MTSLQQPHRRYVDAVLFAMQKHHHQTRADGSPYIAHPLRVAESLRTIGGVQDHDVLIAALLHDLIEDTDCEYETLARRFGERVADLVSALSGDTRLPKRERRREANERIRHAGVEAKAIKLADRLDNLTDMNGFSETKRAGYVQHSREVLEACRGANQALEAALEAAIRALAPA